jgi:hypothetical protein
MPWVREAGGKWKRKEGRTQTMLPAFQAPPRMTFSTPVLGPWGSVFGSAV